MMKSKNLLLFELRESTKDRSVSLEESQKLSCESIIEFLQLECQINKSTSVDLSQPNEFAATTSVFYYVVYGDCEINLNKADSIHLQSGELFLLFEPCDHNLSGVKGHQLSRSAADSKTCTCSQVISGEIRFNRLPFTSNENPFPPVCLASQKCGSMSLASDLLSPLTKNYFETNSQPYSIANTLLSLAANQMVMDSLDSYPEGTIPLLTVMQDEYCGLAIAEMLHHPEYPWTLEKLAATCHMPRSSFSRRFREIANETPMEILTQIRMRLAKSLLRKQLSIQEIALKVGYRSASALSVAFSRRMGQSPQEFRNSHHDVKNG